MAPASPDRPHQARRDDPPSDGLTSGTEAVTTGPRWEPADLATASAPSWTGCERRRRRALVRRDCYCPELRQLPARSVHEPLHAGRAAAVAATPAAGWAAWVGGLGVSELGDGGGGEGADEPVAGQFAGEGVLGAGEHGRGVAVPVRE